MSLIRSRTDIPSPRSRTLRRRREVAVPRGGAHAVPVVAAAAHAVLDLFESGDLLERSERIGARIDTFGNIIRFLIPLTITVEQLDEGLEVLSTCFAALTLEVAAH